MTRRIALLVLAGVLLSAGCSEDRDGDAEANATTTTTLANVRSTTHEYDNQIDGISASWPDGWHRATEPLNPGRSGHIELIALTTFEDPRAGKCSPHPDAAMAAMKDGDTVFVLRTNAAPVHDQPPRPANLLAAARRHRDSAPAGQPAVEGSCFPTGVEAWSASFRAHGRHYEAFVAARAPLSDRRRRQLQQIWSQLEIRPIETGLEDAKLGRSYWHDLYTHCGIKGTRFDGREWVADPELSDGQGNPPREWADAIPGGTITLTAEDVAVYENRGGKLRAKFRPRTREDAPAGVCQ